MKIRTFLPILLAASIFSTSSFAQDAPQTYDNPVPSPFLVRHPGIHKFYMGGTLDGAIFSTATIHQDGMMYDPSGNSIPATDRMGVLRFTYFLNLGFTFNFNFCRTVGMYTGVDIKNIGYIQQDNGYTDKRRVYNIGAPLGIKIGNMTDRGSYLFAGGGMDVAINFQEKYFKNGDRGNKTRINEWWSDRTPRTMPYVFLGYCFSHHITVKAQYYPNNFMNVDYTDANGNRIYSGTDVHLILLSVGFGMHWSMSHNHSDKNNCRGHNATGMSRGTAIRYGN